MRLKAAFISVFLMAAAALPAAWQDHIQAAVKAQKQARWKAAEEELLKAMLLAEKFGQQDPRLAYTLDYLGLLYLNQDQACDAKRVFARALAGFEASKGPDSPEARAEAGRLGEACARLEQWAEAEAHYRRVLDAALKDAKPDSWGLAGHHTDLGLALDAQGKYDDAMAQYQRAKELRLAMAAQSVELAETLSNQARVHYMKGELGQAEELFRQALAMDEKVAGPKDALVADDLKRLAPVLRKGGKEEEASAAEARAQAILDALKKKRKAKS